jgi:hypothetical protein
LLAVLPQIAAEPSLQHSQRLAEMQPVARQQLLQTLLFMPVVDLYRPYELRSYSGDALGLLTEREQAYGYVHSERFLSQLAHANADESAEGLLSQWIANLWQHDETSVYYVDGHRKPVYSDRRLPRGLIGRTGQILGARSLTLLHDEQGHPLFVSTARGDQHLTLGLPAILQNYPPQFPQKNQPRIVVDRECMAAEFLAEWSQHYCLITLLKSNQYQGLDDFSQVSEFVPLLSDQNGQVLQELASAEFALSLPKAEKPLNLFVALIRDHRQALPLAPAKPKQVPRFQRPWAQFMDADWQAQATPPTPTSPKLIAIVATQRFDDPQTLVRLYRQRWQAQENVIKDFLLPLGLDVNHGYAKQQIENSEFRKHYDSLEQKAQRLDRWRKAALQRMQRANRRQHRLNQELQDFAKSRYRQLNQLYLQLDSRPADYQQQKAQLDERHRELDAEIEQRRQMVWLSRCEMDDEFGKAQNYAQQQCQLQRQILDLEAQFCAMFELDNRKDQLMSLFKISLANLILWTRDRFFPPTYAHATWKTLKTFFRLPGRILRTTSTCTVTLRPFNDLALTRDLLHLCHIVNAAQLKLPNGLDLHFAVAGYE